MTLYLVLGFISMATYSSGVPNPACPSRRPSGPPQDERIRKRIYEMLHLGRLYYLALAEAAGVTLLAALLVDERGETAVGTHVARLQGGLAARR